MHELSLLGGVTDIVSKAVEPSTVVRDVGLVVGARSGVLVDALFAAWPVAKQGTCCAGASLHVTEVAATVWCPACEGEQEIDEYFALTCPECGTPTADLRRGKEFHVDYVDVETD
ncbi:hydrogenase maturation nickel metallochaperone HypA [Corynebacterium breve]|uniref:Hydrogenase maturation nickel metallochaperone HypA n=1 Tax=Corynebacterium breve TaxID=3049799 RepID=A0ABY8VF62_9CORY|nr:hydrogenase maturation nickel metallochaperone HypA [Corynebacterium breve]WIM68281.1 hydrogenase maturation nickel metallochaperone HypA [Corynebacterium breve]